MAIKHHRGKYQEQVIIDALDTTRINEQNRSAVIQYLCEGKRLKDLPVSKQQAWSRIKKIVDILKKSVYFLN